MLLAEGCKLLTRDGFRPVESFDGKAVEVSSLPYYDMINILLHAPEGQEVTVSKKEVSHTSGLEGMPLHRTTNFLCTSPYDEKDCDLMESAYFLNTMQTYHAGAPAIVTNNIMPENWIEYDYKHPDYQTAVDGIAYYAEGYSQISKDCLDEIEYGGEHKNYDFILKTDVSVYKAIRWAVRRGRQPSWKFVDYKNTRMYFTDIDNPDLARAFATLGHLIRYQISYHDGKLKLYLPTLDLDKVGKRTLTDLTKVLLINAKRKFRNRMLQEDFGFTSLEFLGPVMKKMLSAGCYPGYVPSLARQHMDTVQMMYLPVCFRIAPLYPGRKATIVFPKSCWFPLSYFENVQWYEVYSATPKLLFVEAPSGLLFIVSTIGGSR